MLLGTPGPNSSRSSLSALTFLDEPEPPLGSHHHISTTALKASYSRSSKESVVGPNHPTSSTSAPTDGTGASSGKSESKQPRAEGEVVAESSESFGKPLLAL